MKERGMSTGAIVAIVGVIVGVVIVGIVAAVFLMGGGTGMGITGIAAMPGSTARGDIAGSSGTSLLSTMSALGGTSISESDIAGISIDIYSTASSATEVVNYYAEKWQGEGYTENFSEAIDFSQYPEASMWGLSGSMGVAGYEKGDQMVGVFAMSYQNETYYILFAASKSTIEALINSYSGWSY